MLPLQWEHDFQGSEGPGWRLFCTLFPRSGLDRSFSTLFHRFGGFWCQTGVQLGDLVSAVSALGAPGGAFGVRTPFLTWFWARFWYKGLQMEPKRSPNGAHVAPKGTKVAQNPGAPWDRINKKSGHSVLFFIGFRV